MTLTTHPHSIPDALVATLPAHDRATLDGAGIDSEHGSTGVRFDDPTADRLGLGCRTCAEGTYAAGPGAGHVTCDACGHATIRRGAITRPQRRH